MHTRQNRGCESKCQFVYCSDGTVEDLGDEITGPPETMSEYIPLFFWSQWPPGGLIPPISTDICTDKLRYFSFGIDGELGGQDEICKCCGFGEVKPP